MICLRVLLLAIYYHTTTATNANTRNITRQLIAETRTLSDGIPQFFNEVGAFLKTDTPITK